MGNMTSLNISLPRSLTDYVEDRVREGRFSTPSEYLRALVREDLKRCAQERLEAALLEGLSSGQAIEATPEFWKQLRRQAADRRRRKRPALV
jgi:antitoxin ParD1/3/4